ncbi:MAG TPA: copper oxidase, partial [Thermoanaerobaculia bacterium]|nr:copper oxidase [Thermoanaerobaculia bacterium]
MVSLARRSRSRPSLLALLLLTGLPAAASAQVPSGCGGLVEARVVALDQPFSWNRFGALEPQGMIYALERDVVNSADANGLPDPGETQTLVAGQVSLRRDKRPRPLVLRVNAGQCLRIRFRNLLNPVREHGQQPNTRSASVHVVGLQPLAMSDDGSYAGTNASSVVAPGGSAVYTLFAEREGQFILHSLGANVGGEGDGGSISAGLFGAVIVEPAGSEWYRSQVTQADLELARTNGPTGHPKLDYTAVYKPGHRYAGLPILNMLQNGQIVHSDLTALITGPGAGDFTSPLPTTSLYPERQKPFREFTVIFHDEIGAVQAFKEFDDRVLEFTLHGGRDGFAINYGASGMGAEVLANRFGVGPSVGCAECKYEEFFLSSWVLGDPAMVVDKPANHPCNIQGTAGCTPTPGRKATKAFFPDDPSNVYHSYLNDHVKFRNLHAGTDDHHIFHLHAHQWTHTPRSDKSSYLDSQAIGQGGSYTYEITYGGSGNRNKTIGDAIFHCHFYPHFAQGMWSLWRVHDVLETGTPLDGNGLPALNSRALPDGEILAGTPIPAVVPIPTIPMPPLPGPVWIANGQVVLPTTVTTNPGYPFFVPARAGRRPPHPPLDTVFDGGLPRHYVVNGTATSVQNRLDFSKKINTMTVQWLAETGEPVEKVAMSFHNKPAGYATPTPKGGAGTFRVNRGAAVRGAPYADPCISDTGNAAPMRYYKAADIQLDAVFNKEGWHFPQQRMITLQDDVVPTINGTRPPEPLFFRAESGECVEFWLTNLVPSEYQLDDFQVKSPTDILGQHIHLVKFDVLASDGAANGFNYED